MKILGVIPAHYASTRLPGKVLLDICGKPMIQWVYERASLSSCLSELVVATDDERVLQAVLKFGGNVMMTDSLHPNGSSRSAEVAQSRYSDWVINIQGDEPLIDPGMIDEVAQVLESSKDAVCATLCRPIRNPDILSDPNVVRVVRDLQGYALYFSRSLIPYQREKTTTPPYEHIGLYGYTRDFLLRYVQLSSTPLAETESLEQLRILEHGYKIKVGVTAFQQERPNVNTQKELDEVRRILSAEGIKNA